MSRDLCIMACVFCRDPLFQRWISEQAGQPIDEEGCKAFITTICGVASRSELDTNEAAGRLFHSRVRDPFLAWKEQQP